MLRELAAERPPVRLPAAAGDGQAKGTTHEPEEGLSALPRRRLGGTAPTRSASARSARGAPLEKARRPNDIWVLDFMSDVLETGRRFRVFAVEDQLTRKGLVVEVRHLAAGAAASCASSTDCSPSTAGRA